MIKEQREAIELAKEFTKMDFSNKMGWTGYYDAELKELSQAIDTVLSLIKEQQKEIEKYKSLYGKALSDLVKSDKQIELMADFMYKTGTGRRALSCMFRQNDECNENGCRYCIKQYFAGLVEKE